MSMYVDIFASCMVRYIQKCDCVFVGCPGKAICTQASILKCERVCVVITEVCQIHRQPKLHTYATHTSHTHTSDILQTYCVRIVCSSTSSSSPSLCRRSSRRCVQEAKLANTPVERRAGDWVLGHAVTTQINISVCVRMDTRSFVRIFMCGYTCTRASILVSVRALW